jgi:hypothetical protein
VIDARRGEALALGEWAKMKGLGGMLDGHLKRQMRAPIVNTQLVSSIEEIEIKLHFLIFDKPPNGQEELKLHNQNRAVARFKTWEGPSSRMTQSSAAKRRPRTNAFATPMSFTVETTVLPSFAHRAIRNLGGFIVSHDRIFSRPPARRPTGRREAASEGSMTVSVVQTANVA